MDIDITGPTEKTEEKPEIIKETKELTGAFKETYNLTGTVPKGETWEMTVVIQVKKVEPETE